MSEPILSTEQRAAWDKWIDDWSSLGPNALPPFIRPIQQRLVWLEAERQRLVEENADLQNEVENYDHAANSEIAEAENEHMREVLTLTEQLATLRAELAQVREERRRVEEALRAENRRLADALQKIIDEGEGIGPECVTGRGYEDCSICWTKNQIADAALTRAPACDDAEGRNNG